MKTSSAGEPDNMFGKLIAYVKEILPGVYYVSAIMRLTSIPFWV